MFSLRQRATRLILILISFTAFSLPSLAVPPDAFYPFTCAFKEGNQWEWCTPEQSPHINGPCGKCQCTDSFGKLHTGITVPQNRNFNQTCPRDYKRYLRKVEMQPTNNQIVKPLENQQFGDWGLEPSTVAN